MRRGDDDYHGGGSGSRFTWRGDRLRRLHELGQSFGLTEDSRAPVTISVLVIGIRALPTADGTLHELDVMEQASGRVGTMLVTEFRLRDLLGDCPVSDLIEVDRTAVTWR